MDAPTARLFPPSEARGARLTALLAGASGCLLLVVATSSRTNAGLPPFLQTPWHYEFNGIGWLWAVVPIVVTAAGLCLPRRWPYLLLAAWLLALPSTLGVLTGVHLPTTISIAVDAAWCPLAIVGVLACAQGLVRTAPSWGAAVAGMVLSARFLGSAVLGPAYLIRESTLPIWHAALIAVGLVGLLPAVYRHRRGDLAAASDSEAGRWTPRRIRLVVTGTAAVALVVPLAFLTTERLAILLGVTWSSLFRHQYAQVAVIGVITLVVVAVLAVIADPWALGGAVTAATVQVAVTAPMILAMTALAYQDSVRWLAAVAGVVLGAIAAGNRWRVPIAGTLTVVAATALFIAYAATTGHPEKIAEQQRVIPAALLLILVVAAAAAVVGATAPVLAPRGALPAAVGPIAGVLATGGLQTVGATYLRDGHPVSSYLNPVFHLNTSATLLLTAGAAIGGLGFARLLAERRAERKHLEQVRQEAAAAERDRLARSIHDGVLQVLTLVQRHGSELGGVGGQLASLAGEQEVALRTLLRGDEATAVDAGEDLGATLNALALATVEVSTPAEPVALPAFTVSEVTAAVRSALDNVHRHAGPGANAWVLLEDEGNGVRVSVRDNGIGFPPERLAEAADAGRLGVAQSMRGRISDLGGTTKIYSSPGEGTEVEFWIPRRRHSRRMRSSSRTGNQ